MEAVCEACKANSDTSDPTLRTRAELWLWNLARTLCVYQELRQVTVLHHPPTHPPPMLLESRRGRNVRPRLLDWGISLMTPTCLHDTLGRSEYSNKLGPRWASAAVEIWGQLGSLERAQECHCGFSSPYHLLPLRRDGCMPIKGIKAERVNTHESMSDEASTFDWYRAVASLLKRSNVIRQGNLFMRGVR